MRDAQLSLTQVGAGGREGGRLRGGLQGVLGCPDGWYPPPQVEAEVRQGRLTLGAREDALRLKARAVELLPDAQNNMAKLQVRILGCPLGGGLFGGGGCEGVRGHSGCGEGV